jgi:hypothetical protein
VRVAALLALDPLVALALSFVSLSPSLTCDFEFLVSLTCERIERTANFRVTR